MRKMKNKEATEQLFPVELFIMLCREVLTFESNNKIRSCAQYSPESYYKAVLSCGAVYFGV